MIPFEIKGRSIVADISTRPVGLVAERALRMNAEIVTNETSESAKVA